MAFFEEKEQGGLMARMIIMSFIAHIVFGLFLGGLALVQKRPRIIPLRLVRIVPPQARVETLATKPQPVPPAPPKPIEQPKPAEPQTKKVVQKKVEVKKEETPKPAPTPRATPKPEATAKPKATPQPAATPRPAPPAPAPRVPPPPAPAAPVQASGPLTMQAVDLPDYYILSARQKIESYFSVPTNMKGKQVNCQVTFTILKDGTITNVRMVQSTGDPLLDQAAVRALTLSKELGPLPDSLSKTSIDSIITFDYSANW